MEAIKKYRHPDGRILSICYDNDPESPRTWDNIGTVVSWHNRYNLGDDFSKGKNYVDERQSGMNWNLRKDSYDSAYQVACIEIFPMSDKEYDFDAQDEEDTKQPDDIYMLPVYIYDHSGITINTGGFSCPWDSGQCGWIFTTKRTMDKEGLTEEYCRQQFDKSQKEVALGRLEGEIKTYDQYVRGEVLGFILTKETVCDCCGDSDEEELDSCWGFYVGDNESILDVIDVDTDGFEEV